MFNSTAHPDMKRYTCEIFSVKKSNYTSKYLGMPLEWGQTKKKLFSFLIQCTFDKNQSWRSKFLILARKEIMVKAILHALPSFLMSVFKLLVGIIHHIEKFMRQF